MSRKCQWGLAFGQEVWNIGTGPNIFEMTSGSHIVHVSCPADDALEDMPYADAIIKEVMRLHGIVDGVWRQALEDITVQDHSIRKVRAASDSMHWLPAAYN